MIGERIQWNIYKFIGQDFYVFNIFDIDNYEYIPKKECMEIADFIGLKSVPVIDESFELLPTIDENIKLADGKSALNVSSDREGLVWVSIDAPRRISFKTISNQFILKYDS